MLDLGGCGRPLSGRTNGRTDESDERLGQCCEGAQKMRFGAASAELPRLLPGKPSTPTTSDNMYSVKWDLLLTTGGRCIPLCPRSGQTSHRVLSVSNLRHNVRTALDRRFNSSRPVRSRPVRVAVGFGVLALARLTLLRRARRHRGNDVQLGSAVDRIPTVRP